MSEKIATGVTVDHIRGIEDPEDLVKMEQWKKRRDSARWYIMVGVALMFAGSINGAFAVGGALSCVYGIGGSIYWGRKVSKKDDPWDDPDIDNWESKVIDGEMDDGSVEAQEIEPRSANPWER